VFQGTISKNIIVTNVDIYGESTPLNARTNTSTFTPAVEISNNDWWQQSGGLDIWWANPVFHAGELADRERQGSKHAARQPQFQRAGTGRTHANDVSGLGRNTTIELRQHVNAHRSPAQRQPLIIVISAAICSSVNPSINACNARRS